MGHHRDQHGTLNHREEILIQQRIVSFLMVFSVIILSFFVLIVSMQTREAICQNRATMVVYNVYARSVETNETLVSALAIALKENGLHAEPLDKEEHVARRIDVFDTVEKTLSTSGFCLLQELDDVGVTWRLRYLERSVCHTEREISMEALPNVDHEKVVYSLIALAKKNVRSFLYEAAIITKERDRITTFPQLQSLFPGFNAQTASPRLVKTSSVRLLTNFAAELYYGSTPLDIQLRLEERKGEKDGGTYWRITIYTKNLFTENYLKDVYRIVSELVAELMRRNVEAAGVHLADSTLIDCRRELEAEMRKAGTAAEKLQQLSAVLQGTIAKQLASPYVRVDGELISSNISLAHLLQAEAERKERLEMEKKFQEDEKRLYEIHDGMRQAVYDEWALGIEKFVALEKKEHQKVRCRERGRWAEEWREELAQQHLADEIRLWGAEEQVMAREREAGRAAYRQQTMRTQKGIRR